MRASRSRWVMAGIVSGVSGRLTPLFGEKRTAHRHTGGHPVGGGPDDIPLQSAVEEQDALSGPDVLE